MNQLKKKKNIKKNENKVIILGGGPVGLISAWLFFQKKMECRSL